MAFGQLARALGSRADIAEATDSLNRYQVERVLAVIRERVRPGARIGILGLSYKPHTPVIEESPGVALAARLLEERYPVTAYDPLALAAAQAVLGDGFTAGAGRRCLRRVLRRSRHHHAMAGVPEPVPGGPGAQRQPDLDRDCWRILPGERFAGVGGLSSSCGRVGAPSTDSRCRGDDERPRA